jgi:hypothetical protein
MNKERIVRYYDMDDMDEDVAFFNYATGAVEQQYSPDDPEFYKRLKQQVVLLKEEINETSEAIENKDKAEILKEVLDVGVVWLGLVTMLDAAGYDVHLAAHSVCMNNNSKIMELHEDAEKTVAKYEAEGIKTFIQTMVIGDEEFYSVRNAATGKILKPYFFEKLNLTDYIPKTH